MAFTIGLLLLGATVVGVLVSGGSRRKQWLVAALGFAALAALVPSWLDARTASERRAHQLRGCDELAGSLAGWRARAKHPGPDRTFQWHGFTEALLEVMPACGVPRDSCERLPALLSIEAPGFDEQISIVVRALQTGEPCAPWKP